MVMAMVVMAKASHSNQINSKTHGADDEKFRQSLRLMSFCKALNSLNYNLNTDKPGQQLVRFRGIVHIPTYMRNTPLPNPDKLSIFPNPYGKRWLAGHLLETAANKPKASAMQSNSM